MNNTIKITNGEVLTASGWIKNAEVIVNDGTITAVEPIGANTPADTTIDAEGGYIVPGAIDIHVHGAANHDFMEATPDAWDRITLAPCDARYHFDACNSGSITARTD